MHTRIVLLLSALLVTAGCGDDGGTPDPDAGPPAVDAGPVGVDAGPRRDAGPGRTDAGPGPDAGPGATPEEALAAWIEGTNSAAAESCECFFADQGYASAENCTRVNTFNDDVADCLRAGPATPGLAATLACFGAAGTAVGACYEAAACDETAVDACDGDAEAAFDACPEATDTDFGALTASVLACLAGDTPSTCPESSTAITATGAGAITGTTVGGGDDLDGSCATEASSDRAYLFQAGAAGDYVFDTHGSSFDTLIYVLAACDGEELGCNDDPAADDRFSSELTVTLTADQMVVVVVDGYNELAAGDFVVNITPPE